MTATAYAHSIIHIACFAGWLALMGWTSTQQILLAALAWCTGVLILAFVTEGRGR